MKYCHCLQWLSRGIFILHHVLGHHFGVKLLRSEVAQCYCGLTERAAIPVSFLGNLCGLKVNSYISWVRSLQDMCYVRKLTYLVIADVRVQRRDEHQTLRLSKSSMRSWLGSMPTQQLSVKLWHASPEYMVWRIGNHEYTINWGWKLEC